MPWLSCHFISFRFVQLSIILPPLSFTHETTVETWILLQFSSPSQLNYVFFGISLWFGIFRNSSMYLLRQGEQRVEGKNKKIKSEKTRIGNRVWGKGCGGKGTEVKVKGRKCKAFQVKVQLGMRSIDIEELSRFKRQQRESNCTENKARSSRVRRDPHVEREKVESKAHSKERWWWSDEEEKLLVLMIKKRARMLQECGEKREKEDVQWEIPFRSCWLSRSRDTRDAYMRSQFKCMWMEISFFLQHVTSSFSSYWWACPR